MYPHEIVSANAETATLEVICFSCKKPKQLTVPRAGYVAWKARSMCIQDAMPTVSRDDRELLISGMCPVCWKETFGV